MNIKKTTRKVSIDTNYANGHNIKNKHEREDAEARYEGERKVIKEKATKFKISLTSACE